MTDCLSDGFVTPTAEAQPYAAASSGRRVRAWRVPSSGPNASIVYALGTIRSRARAAARNDPWAGTALDKLTSNGIGTGIQAKGLYGNKEYQKAEKKLFRRWCKVCDADGVLDFYGLQALAWREWHEAGEIFIRLRKRRTVDGLPVPLQIQIIEAEHCPADLYTTTSSGNEVRAGIEFNAIGKRVAYWMYREHPGEYVQNFKGSELVRVPAEDILHVYEPLRAGQLRGIPRATSVLLRMFNLDSFDDAVLERHKIANLFAGFYTSAPDTDSGPAGMLGDMQTGTDHDDVPLAGLEPGTMQELPAGMKPEFSDPPQAGQEYGDFMRGHLMAIAARHGVPYEVLTGDLRDVSDRALRLILNEFRRVIEMWQWLILIPMFCQPVREAYLDAAVLAGALDIPGYADVRDDVFETLWVPQGWPYSHPVQDVNADVIAIRAGLQSRSATVLGNGDDAEQTDEEIAADNKRADSLGLILDSDPRKVSNTGIAQAQPAESETSGDRKNGK